ncbi:DNA helicase PIF1, ATP-dependent [Tanacetum coccineum]
MTSASSVSKSATKVVKKSEPSQKAPWFLDQLEVDVTGTIVVMIGRIWDVNAITGRYMSTDFVVSDSKGNMIHCSAKSNVAHNFLRIGGIYAVKNFVVVPNKDEYRIFKHDMFMLEFDRETTVRKVSVDFRLVDLNQIEVTNSKYLIDVAGYVTNVGRTTYTKSGSKTLDFFLANQRGYSLRVTLWGGLGDVLVEWKTNHVSMCAVVLTRMSVKDYNNKLYLSNGSSTVIYDDDDIPCIQELKADSSYVQPTKAVLAVDSSLPREGTLKNLLIWARNRQNNTVTFHCKVMIENFRNKKGWNYPSYGYENCRKGATRQLGKWFCEACNRHIDYPVFRYMLEVVVADDTASTVVVMFNDTAMELIKCLVELLMVGDDEGAEADPDSNLPTAIRNLVGTTHILEIKSHTYYEYGSFESFTCWKINPSDPVDDATSSSTPTLTADEASTSFKRLAKNPTVKTPSKPNEEKKRRGKLELEDSDGDEACQIRTSKERGSQNKQATMPTLTELLQKSVRIDSNTITRQDGRVQSYCGLKLTETPLGLSDQLVLPDTTTINIAQIAGPSTSRYASTRRPRRSAGPMQLRTIKKSTNRMAYTSAAIPVTYHNIGPPSHQCQNCDATMCYEEREVKAKRAVNPTFSLFFHRGKNEVRNQTSAFINKGTSEGVDEHIVASLIQMMDQYSSVAKAFRMARDWCTTHNSVNFHLCFHSERKTTKQYNAPTVSEVAALILNDFGDGLPIKDNIVNGKDDRPKRISELHPSYMALQYPLLFPYGEDGFHDKIPYHTNRGGRKTKRGYVTMKEYYSYIIQQQPNESSTLLKGELYHNLCDAVKHGDTSAVGLGKRIVLPRTFTGSPRYMMQNYQDAMALCRTYDNPDLFITFPSNPKWPEISEMLTYFPGQKSHDRPEIGTRVFKIKLTELLDDLTKIHVFGESRGVVYVIEFQKRGLPHAHILLWLKEHCKCKTPSDIDDIIFTELPSPTDDPDAYKIVTDYMLHGPCGKDARNTACTTDGKCLKHFPKQFLVETFLDEEGYPHY